ncbi:hypothetical protein CW304_21750 [Bacillus sp. UFRGS-B20]|nr:hypothetical protein CW304_21750 [Bacillus sp. UFRGS-B20]
MFWSCLSGRIISYKLSLSTEPFVKEAPRKVLAVFGRSFRFSLRLLYRKPRKDSFSLWSVHLMKQVCE